LLQDRLLPVPERIRLQRGALTLRVVRQQERPVRDRFAVVAADAVRPDPGEILAGERLRRVHSPANTTMSLALRAAGERGTDAQDGANGAASGVAADARALPATLVVAVAVVATSMTASTVPAKSQRRFCIERSSVRGCQPGVQTAAEAA